ncbi:DUF6152 family protein [Acuticoccus sp. I52.16.1]|uniref:DUF6152 family protein n=1 Tax=Acuticoccus sp. I52.16.1 TaxID=2928472 RepID=UPI001FD4C403|nr:DUF6152 family protein [Acuticoccus sp. I52.16.1]UOM34766.1 DUF6152 family protein [Acuticoccus sp. I52.16.1]
MSRLTRRTVTALLAAAVPACILSPAFAHHGWSWTSDGNIELTGVIRTAKLGNPHGVLTVEADGEIWTVEVGQPWRNARAGLKDGDLAAGVEIIVQGQPAADVRQKLMKAERIILAGEVYDLYPDRS